MSKSNNSDPIIKEVRALLNHINFIQRKCRDSGLWLSAGIDPYKELTDEDQQGPMVNKLFEMTQNLRQQLNRRKGSK